MKYPGGAVLKTYGEQFRKGMPETGNGLFCYQQNICLNKAGNLLIFNNNNCNPDSGPKLMILKQSETGEKDLASIWEYEFPASKITLENTNGVSPNIHFHDKLKHLGGTISELPDNAVFASVCSLYSYAFIVNTEKELQWCAVSEKLDPEEQTWRQTLQYNASIIPDQKSMEKLIWDMDTRK